MESYSERTDKGDGQNPPKRYALHELKTEEMSLLNTSLLHYLGHLSERHDLDQNRARLLQHLIHITES